MDNNNNFFSIDRLVEFGMGMAVAQQMINMMNQTMQTMYVPGSIQSMPQPGVTQPIYYVAPAGQSIGPLNSNDLSRMIMNKQVTKDTLAWMPGMAGWQTVQNIPAILRIVALMPPPLPQTNVQP